MTIEASGYDADGIVIYTDGSARPTNPGPIGWGVHGYMYNHSEAKPFILDNYHTTNQGFIAVNDTYNGINELVYVEPTDFFDFNGSDGTIGTNNKAELLALTKALDYLKTKKVKNVLVFVDSEYVRKGVVDWSPAWVRNNWYKPDGTEVPHSLIWKALLAHLKNLREAGTHFEIRWIKAHTGHKGNEEADSNSVIGAIQSGAGVYCDTFFELPAKQYVRPVVERHPFINFRRMYFNSVNSYNKPGQYYFSDPGVGDYVVGKRNPDAGFSIVRLNKPDEIIESVRERQFQIANNSNAVCMMRLDSIYSPKLHRMIQRHKGYCLLKPNQSRHLMNLSSVDEVPVTEEMNPTGLSLRAIEAFNYLEDILDRYLEFKTLGFDHETNSFNIKAHDVTSEFYESEVKNVRKEQVVISTLKAEHKQGLNNTYLTVKEMVKDELTDIKLPIVYGTDVLPRNNLKKLETEAPVVKVLTWRESPSVLRYATIIECSSGIGMWSNYFADRVFLNS